MLLAIISLFVVSLGYGVVVPLLPLLAGAGVGDAASLSVVYAAYAAAKLVAQVPGGVWVDRVGPRLVLRVALVLFCLSLAGFLVPSTTPLWFAVWRALEGAATGLVYPAAFAAVLLGPGKKSGARLGTAVALGTSGMLLGPVLGGFTGEDPRLPVTVALGLAVVVTLVALLARAPTSAAVTPRSVGGELTQLWALARNPAFVGTMLPVAFNKFTYSALQAILPLHAAHTLQLGTRGITTIFALTGVGFGVMQVLGGALADRIAPRLLVAACSPVLLLGLAGAWLFTSVEGFALGYGAYIAASSIILTATLQHAAQQHGQDRYGGMYGVLGTLTDVMTVVGPLVLVNIYGAVGQGVFGAMALLGLVFLLGFFVLGRAAR